MNEAFTAFLHAKRIHATAWQQSRPDEFLALEQAFLLMGKASFDARKKFIFNELRKEFLWKEEAASFKRQAASGETGKEEGARDKVQGASEEQPQPEVKKAPQMKLKIPLKKEEEGPSDKAQAETAGLPTSVGLEEEKSRKAQGTSEEQPEVRKAPPMKLKIPLKRAEEGASDKAQGETAVAPTLVGNEEAESNEQKAPNVEPPQAEVRKAPPMKLKIPLKKAEDHTNTPPTV